MLFKTKSQEWRVVGIESKPWMDTLWAISTTRSFADGCSLRKFDKDEDLARKVKTWLDIEPYTYRCDDVSGKPRIQKGSCRQSLQQWAKRNRCGIGLNRDRREEAPRLLRSRCWETHWKTHWKTQRFPHWKTQTKLLKSAECILSLISVEVRSMRTPWLDMTYCRTWNTAFFGSPVEILSHRGFFLHPSVIRSYCLSG